MFRILKRDGLARLGVLSVSGKKVRTPTIFPVIDPKERLIEGEELKRMGVEGVITNAYLIWKSKCCEDVHGLIGFDGLVMTDSGAYQLMRYGKIEVSNLEILNFQQEIKSDIGTPLDIPSSRKEDVLETIKRLKEAKKHEWSFLLTAPIQGAPNLGLVDYCSRKLEEMGFDYYALGGQVNLLNEYQYCEVARALLVARRNINLCKPIHVFGVGHPMLFSLLALLGADVFDSASYALFAKEGRYITENGTKRLENLKELPCNCPVCSSHQPEELDYELLAKHNLWAIMREIRAVRQAIVNEELWNYVLVRCRAHPELYKALLSILREGLETHEPVARKRALFPVGIEVKYLPAVERYRERLMSRFLKWSDVLVITRNVRCGSFQYASPDAVFGLIPYELRHIWPVNTITTGGIDFKFIYDFLDAHDFKEVYSDIEELRKLIGVEKPPEDEGKNDMEAKALVKYWYGLEVDVEGIRAKTGKLRRLVLEGELAGTVLNDGRIVPLKPLALRLLREKAYYVETEGAREFVGRGRSVFFKFVVDVDERIRQKDEVIVVEDGELIAQGTAMFGAQERGCGVFVRTRRGFIE